MDRRKARKLKKLQREKAGWEQVISVISEKYRPNETVDAIQALLSGCSSISVEFADRKIDKEALKKLNKIGEKYNINCSPNSKSIRQYYNFSKDKYDLIVKQYDEASKSNNPPIEAYRILTVLGIACICAFLMFSYNARISSGENKGLQDGKIATTNKSHNSDVERALGSEESNEEQMAHVLKYNVDKSQGELQYIQINERNHVNWENGSNTALEIYVDLFLNKYSNFVTNSLYGQDKVHLWPNDKGKYGGDRYNNENLKILGDRRTIEVGYHVLNMQGELKDRETEFDYVAWETSTDYISDGLFECLLFAMNDESERQVTEYSIQYDNDKNAKKYRADYGDFIIECYSNEIRNLWIIHPVNGAPIDKGRILKDESDVKSDVNSSSTTVESESIVIDGNTEEKADNIDKDANVDPDSAIMLMVMMNNDVSVPDIESKLNISLRHSVNNYDNKHTYSGCTRISCSTPLEIAGYDGNIYIVYKTLTNEDANGNWRDFIERSWTASIDDFTASKFQAIVNAISSNIGEQCIYYDADASYYYANWKDCEITCNVDASGTGKCVFEFESQERD